MSSSPICYRHNLRMVVRPIMQGRTIRLEWICNTCRLETLRRAQSMIAIDKAVTLGEQEILDLRKGRVHG